MTLSGTNDNEKDLDLAFSNMHSRHLSMVMQIEQASFSTPWSKRAFFGEIRQNQFAHYYVCLDDQQVIGYGGIWAVLDEAHVTTVAVAPEFRQKKIGCQLMLYLMQQALAKGADKMTLEVRPSNTHAKRLYKALGFEEAGIRKGYYTDDNEDAIIMWKHLLEDGKGD